MDVWKKSIYTRSFEGSIHVDDLLYLYEKIWVIAFLRFPDFKKIEPRFDVRSEKEESRDLTLQEIKNAFSPDEALTGCSFTLRLPPSENREQIVSSITLAGDNRHSLLITVEGADEPQVAATANTIIYKINPYVATMNQGRQSPTPHLERPKMVSSEETREPKPYLGRNVYEAPVVQSKLTDKVREQLERDSRKNTKYILLAILAVVLIVAIIYFIVTLQGGNL